MDNPEVASVYIDGIKLDLSMNSWMGTYFTDIPMTIAIDEHEENFVGWKNLATGDIISTDSAFQICLPQDGLILSPIFEK